MKKVLKVGAFVVTACFAVIGAAYTAIVAACAFDDYREEMRFRNYYKQ